MHSQRLHRCRHSATAGAQGPACLSFRSRRAMRCQAQAASHSFPSFFPPEISAIEEPAARSMAAAMRREPVRVASLGADVDTAFAGPTQRQLASYAPDAPAIVLMHGFDSSSLEFRRLYPLLAEVLPTYAVDLVGWGFSDVQMFAADQARTITPTDKREHLKAFLDTHVPGRPVILVGASLGAAKAIDFAHTYPGSVSKLVIIDGQGFIDGIGPMASMPRFLSVLGVQVLRTEWLRQAANKMAYHNKERFAVEDAMRVGRLHTFMPGWQDANVAWMRGGGYAISSKISEVKQETLVLWGRNDEILEPSYATRFEQTLPNCRLVWIEECGHCGHLEQPAFTAQHILEFAGARQPAAAAQQVAAL